jgi:hypothetical protein
VHELHLVAPVVEQRRQAPADPHVDLHPRVLGVLRVHVVAFLVGDHLEGQLVVVAQEEAPLAVLGNGRGALEDLVHRRGLLATRRHEHPRHDREVEGHVAFVALPEVLDHVLGPLVGLGQQHAVGVFVVDRRAHALEELVGLRQVLAVGALALEEVGHGVEAEAVEPEVQPEAQHVDHRVLDLGIVVVEVGLVGEEAVPVVGAGHLVPCPVRRLGVGEDDARLLVLVRRVGPHVPIALARAGGRLACALEPRVLGGGVVHDEVGDDAQPALVGGLDEGPDVVDGAVVRMDLVVVGDVVAAVTQRAGEHRQQPHDVDAQPLQVVELLRQPAEVARAV